MKKTYYYDNGKKKCEGNLENGKICSMFKSRKNSFYKDLGQTGRQGVSSRLVFQRAFLCSHFNCFLKIFYFLVRENHAKIYEKLRFLDTFRIF